MILCLVIELIVMPQKKKEKTNNKHLNQNQETILQLLVWFWKNVDGFFYVKMGINYLDE